MARPEPVRTAVFPVAGLGTRLLPATKAIPKEMLTIVDKPVIQYAVDEAGKAGIEHFVFVAGKNKPVLEDYFNPDSELHDTLKQQGKTDALETLVRHQIETGNISFAEQQTPLGLGHAVWCARKAVGGQPFALLLPDMVMRHDPGCLAAMVDLYHRTRGNIVSVEKARADEIHKYGVVEHQNHGEAGMRITGMVEKPAPEKAPSDLFMNGRYILQPEIFDILSHQSPGAGNEIHLTDAMVKLLQTQDFFGHVFTGTTYDCGSKAGFVLANLAFSLGEADIAGEVCDEIRALI